MAESRIKRAEFPRRPTAGGRHRGRAPSPYRQGGDGRGEEDMLGPTPGAHPPADAQAPRPGPEEVDAGGRQRVVEEVAGVVGIAELQPTARYDRKEDVAHTARAGLRAQSDCA